MVIRELPTEVRNALRTGLVITNASQCVFELVLNSLDAGANSIAVRVDLIAHKLQVVDNGCGMDKKSLDLVGLRYMTSKCRSLEDLRKPLGQFGFRGEALASLRNVSRLLTIESRGNDNSGTFCKVFKEGKAFDAVVSNTQRPSRGTTVTVQDFMYNMPVRRHRIRDALNLERIKGLIEATALTHPQVSFSLRNDVNGSIILQTFRPSDTLKTFSYLFGSEIAQSLIHVRHSSDSFKVYGYISNEAHFQNNLQFIYVNKRLVNKTKLHKFVTSRLVKSSIFRTNKLCETRNVKKSNGNWLDYSPAPKRETFPVYLLNIKCAYTAYDVSFDPQKTLLEFLNWDAVLKCLEEVIAKFLEEKHLGNVEDATTTNTGDKSADASVVNEIEELAQEQALGLVECVFSDDSTKESRNKDGTKTIRGNPAYRKDKREVIGSDSNVSDKRNKSLLGESCRISAIKSTSKSELEPKMQHLTSQLVPVNRWVEDPLTPSPPTKHKEIVAKTISVSTHESTFLSEDPLVYSDNEEESNGQKYNEKHPQSSNNQNEIVRAGSHLSIEEKQKSSFKGLFPLPLFPVNQTNSEYIGLRDIMRKALLLTQQNLSRTRRETCLRDKAVKRNVLKITKRKLTVNHSFSIQSKNTKKNAEKNSNANKLAKTSNKPEVLKSPYFEFLPVVVNDKNQKTTLQCASSPYFPKAPPKQDDQSIELSPNLSSPLATVQSPYFKSLVRQSKKTSNPALNQLQLRNCRQTLHIDQTLNFASRPNQLKQCINPRIKGLPENKSLSSVVDRSLAVDESKPNNYSTDHYTMKTRNCVCAPNKHIHGQFMSKNIRRYVNNCQSPSSDYIPGRPIFTNLLRQCDDSRHSPSYSTDQYKMKTRNCVCAPLEHIHSQFMGKQIRRYVNNCQSPSSDYIPGRPIFTNLFRQCDDSRHSNCQSPSTENITGRPTFTHFSRQSDDSRHFPSRPLTLFKPKRNYMTTADLICTLETVRRNLSRPTDMLTMPSPMYRRPTVTWGGVQYHSADEYDHTHAPSDNPSNASCSTSSSLSCYDPVNDDWLSSQRTVQPSHRANHDEDQSRSLGSGYRQDEKGTGESSSYDGDNEFTQADWSSSQRGTILARSNRLEFEAMRDKRQGTSGQSSSQYSLTCPSTHMTPASYDDDGYIPQFEDRVVGNIRDKHAAHNQSPPTVKFNQLFSFSTSEDDRNEVNNITPETTPDNLIALLRRKRKRNEMVSDISKKSRWDNSLVVEVGSVAGSINGYRTSDEYVEEGSESARPSVGDTVSERSSGEEFLADILHEKPLKRNPNSKSQDATANLDACDNVQQITPDDVDKEAMQVSDEAHEGATVSNRSPEAALNVDNDPLGSPGRALDTHQSSGRSEDTRLQPDDATSEWVRRLDADGNTIFVHSRTGMTSFDAPVSSDPYSMESRYYFLPKGLSPILKEKAGLATSMWNLGSVGNEELSLVKWRDDQPKCDDLMKQLAEDAEKRLAFCEPLIPDANIQDRTAVGVYQLLTSYTFTKDVFTAIEVLGQLDNKFIVTLVSADAAKSPHLLVLFDQHAVDERVRLEHLVEDYLIIGSITQFKTTPIESPIVINLADQELRIVSSFEKEFKRIGLRFESPTETSLKVTSVPSCLKARESRHYATLLEASVETLVKGHVNAIVSGGGVGPRIPNTLQTAINSEACRGAIKFGDALSIEACKRMLTDLSECALPFQCAHGRPSLVPLVDISQIENTQRKVDSKPNYQNIQKYLRKL